MGGGLSQFDELARLSKSEQFNQINIGRGRDYRTLLLAPPTTVVIATPLPPSEPLRASQSPSNGLVAGTLSPGGGAVIPDSVTRYPIVNAIADPNHTPTTSWLARESGSGNQSPTGILTTSGVSRVS